MLERVQIADFRCLCSVTLEPDPRRTLIWGENASGKTSLLEAIFFLGRGRSFRTPDSRRLVRDGAEALTLMGRVRSRGRGIRIGIQAGKGGALTRVDGSPAESRAVLAEALPVQVINPAVHQLVEEGPARRRRFLDWGVFHVKHKFLPLWRRYQRALRQRNAGLRQEMPRRALSGWEEELISAGEAITAIRAAYLTDLESHLGAVAAQLLDFTVQMDYRTGWSGAKNLQTALDQSWKRDRKHKLTHVGPHRADVRVRIQGHAVRDRISRGEQKLLAASLILAQMRQLIQETGRRTVLLLDDPAAELDARSLERFAAVVNQVEGQVIITSLSSENLPFTAAEQVFHVKQGSLRRVV